MRLPQLACTRELLFSKYEVNESVIVRDVLNLTGLSGLSKG
jgi:hypothetical protein